MTKALDSTSFVKAALRAIVRWCLRRGVRSAFVEEIVRETFVEEASREIRKAQGEFSVSKVSVITGLHRSEVARLLKGEGSSRGEHDVLNRVIGLWGSAKRYRTKSGAPRALTYEGLGSEFAQLVADVSKEVTHYPILFELERIGAIEYRDGTVRLMVKEYTPQEDVQYGLDLLTEDVGDLSAAVEANLTQKHIKHSLHLRTAFDNIDPHKLPEIREWILKLGAEFHSKAREHLALYDHDLHPQMEHSPERARVAITSFSYAEPIEAPKVIAPKKRGRKRCDS